MRGGSCQRWAKANDIKSAVSIRLRKRHACNMTGSPPAIALQPAFRAARGARLYKCAHVDPRARCFAAPSAGPQLARRLLLRPIDDAWRADGAERTRGRAGARGDAE